MHRSVTAAVLVALMSVPAAAWAQMSHDHGKAAVQTVAAPAAVGTTGKVNAVDAGKRTVNLTHGPIPALGWPAMTMDFGVAPGIDLASVKPGETVAFTVGKNAKGVYLIDTLKPAK